MTATDATVTPIHDEDDNLRFADQLTEKADEEPGNVPEFFTQRRNYIDHLENQHHE